MPGRFPGIFISQILLYIKEFISVKIITLKTLPDI